MKEILEKGRVPSKPITHALKRHVFEHDGDEGELLKGLAETSGIRFETLESWLYRPDRYESMPFPVADSLLCAMGRYWLWYGDLREVYEQVDLNWKKCEREGCETWFRLSSRTNHHFGARRRRFCSTNCGQMQHLYEKGRITSAVKYNRTTHCRNGHRRADAGVDDNGTCLECISESNARMRLKHAEKRRAYQREWYAKNKEAKKAYQREWNRRRKELAA